MAPVATPEGLLRLPDYRLFELVDDELLEIHKSLPGCISCGLITAALAGHANQTFAGDVLIGQTYQCFPNDVNRVRRPDVSMVLAHRIPAVLPEGHAPFRPDIAVEMVDPADHVYMLDKKLDDYRAVNVPMIWVVNPKSRMIRV